MKLKYSIFATIAALSLTACSDFLEPDSESEFVPEDATSLNELLLGEAYQRNDMDGFNIYLGLLDDDVEAAPYQSPNEGFDGNLYLASYSWQPDMYKMMEEANAGHINIYERYYEVILGANAVLDYIPSVNDSEENINKVKAQAYALRGFYYFNLVNIYGQPYNVNPDALGVPLKLNSGIEESEDYLKRKSVSEVYEQILSDLHTAESTYLALPESEQWSDNYRTSLPMVQLMLSRTYLYMENWAKAAEYAKLVMDNKQFKLIDLNDVPLNGTDEEGKPVRNYYVFPTYKSSETIWPYGNVKDMFEWTHKEANSQNSNTGGKMHAYFQASEELLNTYVDYDLRLNRYIVQAPVGSSSELMHMAFGKVYVGTSYYLPQNAVGVFGRCLRLSEAYLNYAEAKAMLGGEGLGEATDALNALREKRFDPEDFETEEFDSQEELVRFIRDERRRELCFEGHRWFDLRRWGMPAITHKWHDDSESTSSYRLEEGDLLYTLPIPDEAMNMNSSLEQNELPGKRVPTIE
ncbi:MAG: RagB/SusD family nutrient uptake outer membrane protein [Bacteroidaceae bacterium]|nr:RagB/SusD family nutrient uptake outer membrane protein [Bacteroidaceae bacterium]